MEHADERGSRVVASAVDATACARKEGEQLQSQGLMEEAHGNGDIGAEVQCLRLFGGAAVVRAVRECSQGLMRTQAPTMSVDEVRECSQGLMRTQAPTMSVDEVRGMGIDSGDVG